MDSAELWKAEVGVLHVGYLRLQGPFDFPVGVSLCFQREEIHVLYPSKEVIIR